jgi:hypothetical protein
MKYLVNVLLMVGAIVAGTFGHETAAEAGNFSWSWESECWDQYCDNHEKWEYMDTGSYWEECRDETCDSHERLELVEAWDTPVAHMRDTHDHMLWGMEYATSGDKNVYCSHFYGEYFKQVTFCR